MKIYYLCLFTIVCFVSLDAMRKLPLRENLLHAETAAITLKKELFQSIENKECSEKDFAAILQKAVPQYFKNVNKIRDDEGDTLLLAATRNGKEIIVQALLKSNACPNIHDRFNTYPILLAAADNRPAILKLLLDNAPVINPEHRVSRALYLAIRYGNSDCIELFWCYYPEIFQTIDSYGCTLLMRALAHAKSAIALQLISYGVDTRPCCIQAIPNGGHPLILQNESALSIARRVMPNDSIVKLLAQLRAHEKTAIK